MRWQPPAVDTSALGGDEPGRQNSGRQLDLAQVRQMGSAMTGSLPNSGSGCGGPGPGASDPSGGSASNGLASIAENSGVAKAVASPVRSCVLSECCRRSPADTRFGSGFSGRGSANSKDGSAASTRVTVDLEDPRTGLGIATKTLVASELEETASVVAAYVARQIFRDDPTAPPWCVGSFDGDDLAAMLFAGRQRVSIHPKTMFAAPGSGEFGFSKNQSPITSALVWPDTSLPSSMISSVIIWRRYGFMRLTGSSIHASTAAGTAGMSLEMIATPEFGPLDQKIADRLDDPTLIILGRCGVMGIPQAGRPPQAGATLRRGVVGRAKEAAADGRRERTVRCSAATDPLARYLGNVPAPG